MSRIHGLTHTAKYRGTKPYWYHGKTCNKVYSRGSHCVAQGESGPEWQKRNAPKRAPLAVALLYVAHKRRSCHRG